MRGWRSYFGFCETPEVLIYLTGWVRLRLRAALWRQWKTPRRRRAALLELGVRPRLASNTAGSGLGPWYLAKAKALDRFKRRIREITRRAKSVSLKTTMEELAPYMRGWRSYFGFCETPEVLIGLTRWVRLRLRAAMWRQWKTPRRRRAALLKLGVRPRLVRNTAGSQLGPWYLAKATALSVELSNAYFESLGLPSLFEEVSA